MDYEKKYKEAQKWIESIYSELSHEQQMEAEAFFPELKESEGEESKKWILEYLYDGLRKSDEQFKDQFKSAIAWLEKQGEQKTSVLDFKAEDWCVSKVDGKIHNIYNSVAKVEPKFKAGDWVVTSYGKVNQVITVDKDGDGFTLDDDTYFSGSWKDGYHLWTIQDAKDGDVLCVKYGNDEMPFIFTGKQDNVAYCALNSFGEFVLSIAEWLLKTSVLPATKEQRDLLFKKMKEVGYEWDAEKKELKKISQRMVSAETKEALYDKPAWSEEDEKTLNEIFSVAARASLRKSTLFGKSYDYIKWQKFLKSLRPQNKWKPSEEQMEALESATENCAYSEYQDCLRELIEQLKKLK